MTASELHHLLTSTLVRMRGGDRVRWRKAVGQIKVYPLSTHPHCNWDVRPAGSAAEIVAVERAVDIVRGEHPYIEATR